MDAEQYRAESRRGWGSVAPGWQQCAHEQREAWMPVTARMLDAVRLGPGSRVLELATGTGEVGLMAHELIQPGGELLMSDFAPEMLRAAREQATAAGIDDIRFKQIDIESIDVDAASQDAVLCRWGLMFLADPEAGVREIRRVLRPGGRLATAVWTSAEENPWSTEIGRVLVEAGHAPPPDPSVPGQFTLGGDGELQELLEGAGFVDDIEVEAVDVELAETFAEHWDRTLTMSRIGGTVRGLSAADQAAVRDELEARLARYADGDVLRLPGRSWVAAATA